MKIISEQNVGRVSFFLTVVVVSAIIFAVGVFFVVRTYDSALRELSRLEQRLIDQEKIRLKADVDSFMLRIQALTEPAIAAEDEAAAAEAVDQGEAPAGAAGPDWERVVEELRAAPDLDSAGYFIYHLLNPEGGEHFATMLFNPARPDLAGQPLSTDFPDAKGFNFRKVFLKDIADRGESYVVYHYNRDEEGEDAGTPSVGRKLAYFRLYPGSNWIVAKNSQLDWIDQLVVSRQADLKSGNKNRLIVLGFIFAGGVVVASILAFLFSLGVQSIFEHYRGKEQEILERSEALQKTLEKQNRTDALTSAYNRGYLNQELGKEMSRSQRYGTPLSMILFDLDDFKAFNDRFGCEPGDTVLVELVELVKDNIRQTDVLARWGGEEFVILAPGVDLGQGRLFAEKLRRLIEEHQFSIGYRITCSFGIGCYTPPEGQHAFVQRTDDALGRAKAGGKNCCVAG